jgi:radical SAM-linked protein
VAKPGRYVGGEYGAIVKPDAPLRVAISYPDLYEIGMSNSAIRILYSSLNAISNVACERVFAPDTDFESRLREKRIPLYGLETGTPLSEFDIIGFSVGYELTATNLLNILDLGEVPIHRKERGIRDPVVIAGGPAMTNPSPFSLFLDAVFIGEAEDWAATLFPKIAKAKSRGAMRSELLDMIVEHPSVWSPGKKAKTRRAVWMGFGTKPSLIDFPVPNIRTVQDHGVVEIMRGCPNGCRFCHAGIFYRPYRVKAPLEINREIEHLVFRYGYREITLSSLSSGDYRGIDKLVSALNRRYESLHVSFSLPSLKVEGLDLAVLGELSRIRKSGLTFAVETPTEAWQRSINKTATLERTVEILERAERLGWRLAKIYFMIGLPSSVDRENSMGEPQAIAEFVTRLARQTKLSLNVNVACFIPKPHTPFQWARQLDEEEALARILTVKREWKEVLADFDGDVIRETLRSREENEALPWSAIDLGTAERFLVREWRRSKKPSSSSTCAGTCSSFCGVCRDGIAPRNVLMDETTSFPPIVLGQQDSEKVLLRISKTGRAVFLSHLNLMGLLEKSLLRAGYMARFSRGYNPKPRIEFASPLSVGIASTCEIAAIELFNFDGRQHFIDRLNDALPSGLNVTEARIMTTDSRRSLMSLYWGSDFAISSGDSSLDLPALAGRIEREGNDTPLDVIKQGYDKGAVEVRFRHTGKKGYGFLKILTRNFEIDPWALGLAISRRATWASDEEGNPASYFSLCTGNLVNEDR